MNNQRESATDQPTVVIGNVKINQTAENGSPTLARWARIGAFIVGGMSILPAWLR